MKFRKLAALAMVSVMTVATFAGCGSDDEETTTAAESDKKAESFLDGSELSAQMESLTSGEFEISLGITASGDLVDEEELTAILGGADELKGTVKLKGEYNEDAMRCTASLDLTDAISTEFLEVIYVDDSVYVNVKKLLDEVAEIAGQMQGQEVPVESIYDMLPEGDWLKVPQEYMDQISGTFMDQMVDTEALPIGDMAEFETLEDFVQYILDQSGAVGVDAEKFIEAVAKLVEMAAESLKDNDFAKITDDSVKIHLGTDNINGIIADVAKYASANNTEVADLLTVITGNNEITAEMVKTMADTMNGFDIKAYLKEDISLALDIEASAVDNGAKFLVSFDMAQDGKEAAIELSAKFNAKSDVKIEAPTSVMDEEQVKALIDSMTGSMDGMYDDSLIDSDMNGLYDDSFMDDDYDDEDDNWSIED